MGHQVHVSNRNELSLIMPRNYSVMNSPYGKDVVAQFVASCKKYDVKPCYYMGPNANVRGSAHGCSDSLIRAG